jgi:hypothetical protein
MYILYTTALGHTCKQVVIVIRKTIYLVRVYLRRYGYTHVTSQLRARWLLSGSHISRTCIYSKLRIV